MRKVTFRDENTKKEILRKFKDLKASGYSKLAAAKELGVAYGSVLEWERKFSGDLPTVTISTKKTYNKKDNSQKAIIIVTTLSNVSEVLKSL